MSIPAITAAGVYKLFKVLKQTHLGPEAGPYILGTLVAGVIAFLAVRWFMRYMKEHSTGLFICYRISLGLLLLLLLQLGYVKDRRPYGSSSGTPWVDPSRSLQLARIAAPPAALRQN